VASDPLPPHRPDGTPWPRVAIVTPSYNQAAFVEETLRSVLLQGYPDLEYVVMDGGSTDGSVAIIEKYAPWLTHWTSAPDDGQSDAINRGFAACSAPFGGWINSDDRLCQHALTRHAQTHGFAPGTLYVGDCLYLEHDGTVRRRHTSVIRSFEDLVRIGRFWRQRGNIVQPETLFPLDLFREAGGLNVENHYTMDYELWGDLLLAGAEIRVTGIDYGALRLHDAQKIADRAAVTRSLVAAAHRLIDRHPDWPQAKRRALHASVTAYVEALRAQERRAAQPLAVRGLRALKRRLFA
jgi:hypothetical protein